MIIQIVFLIFFGSLIIGFLGMNRKMGFWGYFFSSLLLTPIMGILLVSVSDPKPRVKEESK